MKVLFSLAAVGALACSGREPVDSSVAAIRGGVEAPDDANVVAVVNFAAGNCSGALIAPQLVLTARHCVADAGGQQTQVVCGQTTFDAPDSTGAIFVVPEPAISDNPDDYLAVSAIGMPDNLGDDLCGTDVVLLRLKEPLDGITALVPRLDAPALVGEAYSAVGYGVDSALDERPSGVRKRLDGLTVTCSGADCGETEVKDNEWLGSGGPCSGDSGGPALDADGLVLGVVSRGQIGCKSPVFGDLSTRASWLKAEAVAAAMAANSEPPAWACEGTTPCGRATAGDLEEGCSLASRPPPPLSKAWPLAVVLLGLLARRGWPREPRTARA